MAETTERVNATPDEPLPNGGAYAIVHYQDVDGTPVTKAEALRAEVFEYKADGTAIAVTILDMTGVEEDDG